MNGKIIVLVDYFLEGGHNSKEKQLGFAKESLYNRDNLF